MIIVSQDKNKIVNFDNITFLDIDKSNGMYIVKCNTINENRVYLGEYATEEKAREILGEIAKVYQYYKGKTYTIGDYESLWGTYDYGVYQMLERR